MHRVHSALQVLVLLMMVTMLAGCGALIAGGTPTGGQETAAPRSGGDSYHDAAITSSINSRYVNDHLVDALAIRVTTWQGVVTLQGSVRSQAAAARAVELARSTPNVRRVVSRLTVTP